MKPIIDSTVEELILQRPWLLAVFVFLVFFFFFFGLKMACAQAPKAPAIGQALTRNVNDDDAPAALTATEHIALSATAKDYQTALQAERDALAKLHQIEADIAKSHPGYRLDEASGALVKLPDTAPKMPDVGPKIDGSNDKNMPVQPASQSTKGEKK